MRYGLLASLVVWAVASGCQCGIGIVASADKPGSTTPNDGQKRHTPPLPRSAKTPSEYQIRGVAMLAFYPSPSALDPGLLDPSRGTLNGYVVLYDSLQKTTISAWAMEDGECRLSADAHSDAPDFRGLDGGDQVFASIDGRRSAFERRSLKHSSPKAHVVYNFPTFQGTLFGYGKEVVFESGGAREFPAFHIGLKAPAKLRIESPPLTTDGLVVHRDKGLKLQWSTVGDLPYIAVRINQRQDAQGQTHTLLCRFANTGAATISAQELSRLAADPEGKSTSIYFSPTTYKLASVPGLDKPILAVVRATTTLPLKLR